MPASNPGSDAATPTKTDRAWGAPIDASLASLELIASERPGLLEFQAHVLGSGTMSFAVQKLAAAFAVPPEKVGPAIAQACRDLDRLENQRGRWQDPVKILGSPNLAALRCVCDARLSRVWKVTRRLRLERIRRRIEDAYKLAKTRVWIDDFIGPLPAKPVEKSIT